MLDLDEDMAGVDLNIAFRGARGVDDRRKNISTKFLLVIRAAHEGFSQKSEFQPSPTSTFDVQDLCIDKPSTANSLWEKRFRLTEFKFRTGLGPL